MKSIHHSINSLLPIHLLLYSLVIAVALTACVPQAPQRPSQRSGQQPEPDSATLAMVELHQRLADAADVELNNYIRNHPGQWFAQDDGSWVMGVELQPDTKLQTRNTIYSLRLVTRDLDGNLLSDVQGEYELGKCQLPSSVESTLNSKHQTSDTKHQTLSTLNYIILAPWYVAYGSQGNEFINGYQNVTIEVYIL